VPDDWDAATSLPSAPITPAQSALNLVATDADDSNAAVA
jgi:hypothetical protein